MGHPGFKVTDGTIIFKGEDITAMPSNNRATRGLFLAFQYPEEVPGVSVVQFLRTALKNRDGVDYTVLELRLRVMDAMRSLGMDATFADRYLNEGFSGGERKRNEVLQLAVLQPELAVMDETDSGLDIDALRTVAEGVKGLTGPERAFLIITHYQRLLEHITPDHVHIFVDGAVVESGGPESGEAPRGRGLRGIPQRGDHHGMTDLSARRADFPLLAQPSNGHRLVFLDSAASAQKPSVVIDAMDEFLRTKYCQRPPRGLSALTRCHRGLRARPPHGGAIHREQALLAKWPSLAGTTSALNSVAFGWGLRRLRPGGRVLVTMMEHHANIVPWHMVAGLTGAEVVWAPLDGDGELDLGGTLDLIDERVKIVAVTGMSNVLGTIPDLKAIADAAHTIGARVVVDGAQLVAHRPVAVGDNGGRLLRLLLAQDRSAPTGIRRSLG